MHLSGVCVDQCGTRAAGFCLIGFPLMGVTEYGLFPGVGADPANFRIPWLIPFSDGDRDVVPNNNTALLHKFFSDINWSNGFAVGSDFFDPVPDMVVQLFGWASFRPYRRFARSGWLKEERPLICVYGQQRLN